MRYAIRFMLAALLGLYALGAAAAEPAAETIYRFNFANGSLGWSADFAEYPAGSEEFYELAYDFAKLPLYLAAERFALRLTGANHSDDLCMFLRRKVTGLKPNTDYQVRFEARIASNAPRGAVGIGGAPGESVAVKAGVSLLRPAADPLTRLLNIQKGHQSQGGADAVVLGHVGVDTPIRAPKYRFKTLGNAGQPMAFRTNDAGEAWLFFATDSGFEGTTRIFVVRYEASFTETP